MSYHTSPGRCPGSGTERELGLMKVQASEARSQWSALLDAVRHGAHVEVARYITPSGYLVPPEFYRAALAALGLPPPADSES